MDDIPGLLTRDFGYRAQGKSAPMASSRGLSGSGSGSGGNVNLGFGSGGDARSSSSTSSRGRSMWNSTPVGSNSFLDDHDGMFGPPGGDKKMSDLEGLGVYGDVFGGPAKNAKQSDARGGASSASFFDYDSVFQGANDSGSRSSSLPVFDKPVYDDDAFEGAPGQRGSSSVNYDDIFSSVSSRPNQSDHFDDLLENLGKKEPESSLNGNKFEQVERDVSDFDDLIPGFGGSSPPVNRATSESSGVHQPSVSSNKANTNQLEDPFVVLETGSVPAYGPSGLFADSLEQLNKPNNSNSNVDGPSDNGGNFDDPLDEFVASAPSFPSDVNRKGRDRNQSRTVPDTSAEHTSAFGEPTAKASQKKVNMSSKSEENLEAVEDIWLTVSEVPLFTQPTAAPPPSRPPPSRLNRDEASFLGANTMKVNEFSSFRSSSQNFQSSKTTPDSIDELEDFAMGRARDSADDHADSLSSEEEADLNSTAAASAAAMKEAMDKAEARFKHAREMRDRDSAKAAKTRETVQFEKGESSDAQEQELREKQERLMREQEDREREEKEKEEKRLERERERAREIVREREKARQAVERATREARERAAAEARLRAERAAVEKVNAEARLRAERAAVQRAQAEARERAAAEAKERAERAAAEARERERAAAEAREKANAEARERAAVARAETEVRLRAERAAFERAAAEARERAAAEARERAAAAARENQQNNENDLESFFSMGSRATSVPKARTTTSDSMFDAQFQARTTVPDGARRTSTGTSSGIRKASSATNIVDDLSSIFGGAPSSGEFQEIDGESEERRRARLERHQRTQERAAKALAEKNQRDLQVQSEQAERHRIAETLDAEIKRWAAGKEGNLRALLSTLQYVLWAECGWQPVSLTDLITAASVKKVYRKATLCIHPDKVQQKGANLQQKYVAEKVFDLLKEAWNKFNSEELF